MHAVGRFNQAKNAAEARKCGEEVLQALNGKQGGSIEEARFAMQQTLLRLDREAP